VEPKGGINCPEIRRAVARLFYVFGIPEKNGIWVFRIGQEKFSSDDLYRLKDLNKENFRKDVKINKTAKVYNVNLSRMLPFFLPESPGSGHIPAINYGHHPEADYPVNN